MKTKAMNSYSVSGNKTRLDREQRKAAKAFRDSRRNARGKAYQPLQDVSLCG